MGLFPLFLYPILASFFRMIARGIILFMLLLVPEWVHAQEPQDLQVTVTDEALTPLDSIYVALINRISGDTLEIQLTDENGIAEFLEVVITSEEIEPSIPSTLQLSPGYPNPFQEGVSVSAQFTEDSKVLAEVYNTLGQRVLRIPEQRVTAGVHTLNLHMGGLVDGVYFLRLFQNGQVVSRQITKVGGGSGGLLNGSWSQGGVSSKSHLKVTVISEETDLEIHIYDELGEFESDTIAVLPNKFTYSAELSQKTPTETRETIITLGNSSLEGVAANGVDVIIQNEQGETLEQGEFVDGQYVYNRLVEQGSTENLQITFAEHGYIDKTIQYQASGNETLEETIQGVPITLRTQALEIEPNSSQSINVQTQYVQEVVDPDGTGTIALEAIVVGEPSAHITATQEDGYVYTINALNNAQNSDENVPLDVRTATNTVSGTGAIYITPAAQILIQGPFTVSEDDTLRLLNFAENYLQSEADITSWDVTETDMNVEVQKDGEDVLLIPAKDYFGSANFSVQASNKHGTSIDETASVDVDRLPRLTLTYQESVTDQSGWNEGLTTHVHVQHNDGVRTLEEEVQDQDGIFTIKMKGDVYLAAHFDRGSEAFGYVSSDTVSHTGMDQDVLIRMRSFYNFDDFFNNVGELKSPDDPTSEGIDNWETHREWILEKTRQSGPAFNLTGNTATGYFFKWFTETPGKGPADVLLPQKIRFIAQEGNQPQEYIMSTRTEDIIRDIHAAYQRVMGDIVPDITNVDSLTYDPWNNEHRNQVVYGGLNLGGIGLLYSSSDQEAHNKILSGLALVTSNENSNEFNIARIAWSELYSVWGFNPRDDDTYATPEQSVGHNAHQRSSFSVYNVSMLTTVAEPTFTGSTQAKFGLPTLTGNHK